MKYAFARSIQLSIAFIAIFAASACQTTSDYKGRGAVSVLIIGQNEDLTSAPRSSDIYQRVIAQLNAGMARQGFRVIDEDAVAADLAWKIRDRRSKFEIKQSVKLMNASNSASHHVRAYTIFSIRNEVKQLDYATKITTSINGEIYDALTNQFIGGYQLPSRITSGPAGCINQSCIDEIAGAIAREMATDLSDVLGKKLAYLVDRKTKSGGFTDNRKNPDGTRTTSQSVSAKSNRFN